MPPNNGQYPPNPSAQPFGSPNPYGMRPQMGSQLPGHSRNWFLIVAVFVLSVLLLCALSFGIWAFTSRQDYKHNVDQKISSAVAIAKQQEASLKEKEFVERDKNPLKAYKGPASYGSLDIQYPRTWSAFVTESPNGTNNVEGYFHPGFVPGVQSGTDFALRAQVISQPYTVATRQFDSLVKTGKVKVSPYKVAKVPGVTGIRVEGEITKGQQTTMVILPLRDKTVKIWTESPQYVSDFDNIIMANFTFVP